MINFNLIKKFIAPLIKKYIFKKNETKNFESEMIFDLTFFTNGVLWMAYYCTIKIDIGITLGISYLVFVILDSIYIKRKF